MNKIYKLSAVLTACLFFAGCLLSFTACDDDDKLDTNQMGGGSAVSLKSFGPSPIARGAELRFIGTNMDKIQSVQIPGTAAITDIKVVNKTEIRVTVPQDATVGHVILKTATGEITTATQLTYDEPISVDRISPTTARPGSTTIKIEGDYLNLVGEIIFADDVHVLSSDFKSQSRKAIEVLVPLEAQTGKIIVSNGADLVPDADGEVGIPTWIYSEETLTVSTPLITAVAPATVKAGQNIVISGSNLELVDYIVFGGDKEVKTFTLNGDNTAITVKVPADAQEDVVTVVAKSGVAIASKTELKLVVPSDVTAPTTPVKNKNTMTFSGKDMDLVTKVVFRDIEGSDVEVTDFTQIQAASLTLVLPDNAYATSAILVTAAGKEVLTPEFTYAKPVISSISPATLDAGKPMTITGTDLDLVNEVTFAQLGGGTVAVAVSPTSSTSLSLDIPLGAGSGVVTLTTTNGTTVNTAELNIRPSTLPVIISITETAKPGGWILIEGFTLHTVTEIIFENNVQATAFAAAPLGESLQVQVPAGAKSGMTTLTLVTGGGDRVVSPEIFITGTDPVLDPSYVFFNFDGRNSWWGSYGGIENNAELSLDGSKYYRINENLKGGWIDFFWRNGKNDLKTDGVTVDGWVIKMDVNVLGGTTPAFKFRLKGSDGDFWAIFGGLSNNGGWYTVTIPLTDFRDGDGKGSNVLPNVQNIDSDFGLALAGEGSVNICIDNIRFEPK